MTVPQNPTLLSIADSIFTQTFQITKWMKQNGADEPSLGAKAHTDLWTSQDPELDAARTNILGLMKQLGKLLEGPHGFLHEYVSTNWDHGALYTLLEYDILEKIPLDGSRHVSELAKEASISEPKLLCILRLNACEDIIREVSEGNFAHTAISAELLHDKAFKSFIGFQLYETRVASAHLADTLRRAPLGYWNENSAFKYAWGDSMYDWHKKHPHPAKRFQNAMAGVSAGLDPAGKMLVDWFSQNKANSRVVEACGGKALSSKLLAQQFPELTFTVQDASADFVAQAPNNLPEDLHSRIAFSQHDTFAPQAAQDESQVFIIRQAMWNMPDEDCIKLIQSFLPALEKSPNSVLLLNELMSPPPASFDPHVEKAYRRRDVTLTTMHNVKQRTEQEWQDVISRASPALRFKVVPGFTSHSHRGLWELTLGEKPLTNGVNGTH